MSVSKGYLYWPSCTNEDKKLTNSFGGMKRAISGGHALWLIETKAGTLLCDPVLADPFEQGTVTACPSRILDPEKLPSFDVLYLSHRHMDHFDLPTLTQLDKTKPVLIPDDALSIASLKRLGFVHIHPMKPFVPFSLSKGEHTR